MKNKQGLINEVSKGLGKVAFYFFQTFGFPLELFIEEIKKLTFKEQTDIYLYYKNY